LTRSTLPSRRSPGKQSVPVFTTGHRSCCAPWERG